MTGHKTGNSIREINGTLLLNAVLFFIKQSIGYQQPVIDDRQSAKHQSVLSALADRPPVNVDRIRQAAAHQQLHFDPSIPLAAASR